MRTAIAKSSSHSSQRRSFGASDTTTGVDAGACCVGDSEG